MTLAEIPPFLYLDCELFKAWPGFLIACIVLEKGDADALLQIKKYPSAIWQNCSSCSYLLSHVLHIVLQCSVGRLTKPLASLSVLFQQLYSSVTHSLPLSRMWLWAVCVNVEAYLIKWIQSLYLIFTYVSEWLSLQWDSDKSSSRAVRWLQ